MVITSTRIIHVGAVMCAVGIGVGAGSVAATIICLGVYLIIFGVVHKITDTLAIRTL